MSVRRWRLAGIAADADTMTECLIDFDTSEWEAMIEWLRLYAIDASLIPAGTRISRDACNRCIRYRRLVTGDDGKPIVEPREHFPFVIDAVEQGEAPPLPYPDVIARWLR